MKRGQYVRISAFMLTSIRNTPDLYTLALMSIPIWVAEGWLLVHVQPPGPNAQSQGTPVSNATLQPSWTKRRASEAPRPVILRQRTAK
jgi:hypothetical protein